MQAESEELLPGAAGYEVNASAQGQQGPENYGEWRCVDVFISKAAAVQFFEYGSSYKRYYCYAQKAE